LDRINPSYRNVLASALYQRGWLTANGRKDQARAVGLFQGLVDEFPDNSSYRYELTISLVSLASASLGHFPKVGDSRVNVTEIHPIVQRALRIASVPPVDNRVLAHAYCCFAKLDVSEGRPDEGEQKYREAIRLRRLAVKEHPTEGRSREHLVRDCNELGNLFEQRGNLQQAEYWYRQALEAGNALRRDFPSMKNFKKFVAEALKGLTRVLQAKVVRPKRRQLLLIPRKPRWRICRPVAHCGKMSAFAKPLLDDRRIEKRPMRKSRQTKSLIGPVQTPRRFRCAPAGPLCLLCRVMTEYFCKGIGDAGGVPAANKLRATLF
jgi:tetratricopeptide (TPR) repeat protein